MFVVETFKQVKLNEHVSWTLSYKINVLSQINILINLDIYKIPHLLLHAD